jgi:hypothetical protein
MQEDLKKLSKAQYVTFDIHSRVVANSEVTRFWFYFRVEGDTPTTESEAESRWSAAA